MRRIAFVAGVLLTLSVPASANPPRAERELSLALARTCVNEAGFHSPLDCALIWQAVRSHGDTHVERLRWLRTHSPCATGRLSQQEALERPGQCAWTRNLDRSGRRPAHFPPNAAWRPHLFDRVLRYSERLVAGELRVDPCPVAPHTWGGRQLDDARARAQGLEPCACDPRTRNEGWRW